jgi:hypothetical protein
VVHRVRRPAAFTSIRLRHVRAAPATSPFRADLDKDHKLDFVVFRPSTGTWHMSPSSGSPSSFAFGQAGDIPSGLDIDGDGSAELCLFRPSTGQWFVRNRITALRAPCRSGNR